MKKLKSHFRFNKQERSGIFFLLSIIFCLQLLTYIFNTLEFDVESESLSFNKEEQRRIDSLVSAVNSPERTRMKIFNPNYISDYYGYVLGMSLEEIDRLQEFRSSGRFIYSSAEFQEITGVHDTILEQISPYFKFTKRTTRYSSDGNRNISDKITASPKAITKGDLNRASDVDLRRISGIGPVLSARIIKFRNALGGFMTEDQLYDVYGLDSTVVKRVFTQFAVKDSSLPALININTATLEELYQNIYISLPLAKQIIRLRDSLGKINSFDQLTKFQDFPADKIDRIKLYLTL